MKIAILKERRPHETRVAATPETVKKLKALGAEITIETGAGAAAAYTDQAYARCRRKDRAGCGVALRRPATSSSRSSGRCRPTEGIDEIGLLRSGQMLMSPLGALTNKPLVEALAAKGVTAFALELIPRITRAQSMDILSSQANLAGYKAVLLAANNFGRIFPQMMTPGGTLAPARAFIMGVGVAGLQAIATARRLGAIVTATDVRPATKEQVQSLGGKFVAVEDEEFKAAETAGGYAKQMSAEYQAKQAALVAEHIKLQDIVITTALIPGRKAPVLVSEDMVKTMKPGSVIVDMAVEQGGNCPLSEFGKTVEKHGVKIVGPANLPAELADRYLRAVRAQSAELHHAHGRQGDQGAEDRSQRRGRQGHAGDAGRPDRAPLAAQPELERRGLMNAQIMRRAKRGRSLARTPGSMDAAPSRWRQLRRAQARTGAGLADLKSVAQQILDMSAQGTLAIPDGHMPFVSLLTIFALACFVGYYVVWRVTPALHSPLMAVTNAVSSVIIVGALLAAGLKGLGPAQLFGAVAVALAAVNIFGGFIVTHRMLSMFKKKTPAAKK